ncbi:MAG: cytochrome c3 family protein [Actinomycetota bacterium]|nr:cytochrome c3 family protein [Actinomycetota bacterium]
MKRISIATGLTLALFSSLVLLIALGTVSAQESGNVARRVENQSCIDCHNDPNLKREDGRSLNVNLAAFENSTHATFVCTTCHQGFTDWPHPTREELPSSDPILACNFCHSYAYDDYLGSVHQTALEDGVENAPNCADCHTNHYVKNVGDSTGAKPFYASGEEVCGKCHEDAYESYSDYYHGDAYKAEYEGAPACWDCHGSHDNAYVNDPASPVSEANLAKTCESCHEGSAEGIAEAYGPSIHGSNEAYESNGLAQFLKKIAPWLPW